MSESFGTALKDTNEINITVTGRVTGRQISAPVWFAEERGTLYLVPVHGSDSDWYKNVLATPQMQLTANDASITATVAPVKDAARVREVVEKFRTKYGPEQITAYYPKTDVAVAVKVPA